jgi:hypothetical protein
MYHPRHLREVLSTTSMCNSVTQLTFHNDFNKKLNFLPHCLTHLNFGDNFDTPIDSYPPSLISLKFGRSFNCKVDNLPPKLTYLSFASCFQQKIDHHVGSVCDVVNVCDFMIAFYGDSRPVLWPI